MTILHLICFVSLLLMLIVDVGYCFVPAFSAVVAQQQQDSKSMMIKNNGRSSVLSPRSTFQLCMVRNIDLVEAIIFYGKDSLFVADDGNDENDSNLELLLAGVENLVDECIRDETAVLAILPNDNVCNDDSYLSVIPKEITIHRELQTPPNPRDLWTAIHSTQVQPKGFGGSSGFGRKAADPERSPLPKHCVVLCHTEHQCRAARFAGMRVLCLTDNDLADGIMLDDCWESICMDDIATPGSFWLNPPHPKDDEGNAIDIDQVMAFFESSSGGEESEDSNGVPGSASSEYVAAVSEELDDDQLAAMLADIDSL